MGKSPNSMNKKTNKIISSLLVFVSIVTSFALGFFMRGLFVPHSVGITSDVVSIIDSVGFIIDPVTGQPRELTDQDYVNAISSGILDKYSRYYTPEEYEKFTKEKSGSYEGFGVSFVGESNVIFSVNGNSPLDHAGVQSGDVVSGLRLEGGQTVNINSSKDVGDFLKANENCNTVTFIINQTFEYTVTKKQYKVSYVTYYDSATKLCFRQDESGALVKTITQSDKMSGLSDDTGYIKFDHFEADAATQFMTALTYMLDSGKTKLIFDLRNNGGGMMNVLTEMASCLIYNGGKKSSLVTKTQTKITDGSYYTGANKFDQRLEKIVVLANENTASASECLIGAMLCYGDKFSKDKADLVIEKNADGIAKTYGKGIMQTTYLLKNGGAFKLTTGRVLWPDEQTCIHGTGIVVEGQNAVTKEQAILRATQILSN